jgi:hypothetical protein
MTSSIRHAHADEENVQNKIELVQYMIHSYWYVVIDTENEQHTVLLYLVLV